MTTTKQLTIGMIGLDTSHCPAFTKLLNEPDNEYHVPGGKVVYAFPGGSPDFKSSYSRLEKFTNTLRDDYGVQMLASPEEVAERSDAILLTSVDGRVHLEQFRKIASYGKPVFIDKPFAVSTKEATEMVRLASEHNVPLMSASSARFAQALGDSLAKETEDTIFGADCYYPMELNPPLPALYWYGIHAVEMLYGILGKGCVQVKASVSENYEFVVGIWEDGRIGTVRGNRVGNKTNGALIHRTTATEFVDMKSSPKPTYAALLEKIMPMFQTGRSPLDSQEMIEVMRFIEAANESRETGKTVRL